MGLWTSGLRGWTLDRTPYLCSRSGWADWRVVTADTEAEITCPTWPFPTTPPKEASQGLGLDLSHPR